MLTPSSSPSASPSATASEVTPHSPRIGSLRDWFTQHEVDPQYLAQAEAASGMWRRCNEADLLVDTLAATRSAFGSVAESLASQCAVSPPELISECVCSTGAQTVAALELVQPDFHAQALAGVIPGKPRHQTLQQACRAWASAAVPYLHAMSCAEDDLPEATPGDMPRLEVEVNTDFLGAAFQDEASSTCSISDSFVIPNVSAHESCDSHAWLGRLFDVQGLQGALTELESALARLQGGRAVSTGTAISSEQLSSFCTSSCRLSLLDSASEGLAGCALAASQALTAGITQTCAGWTQWAFDQRPRSSQAYSSIACSDTDVEAAVREVVRVDPSCVNTNHVWEWELLQSRLCADTACWATVQQTLSEELDGIMNNYVCRSHAPDILALLGTCQGTFPSSCVSGLKLVPRAVEVVRASSMLRQSMRVDTSPKALLENLAQEEDFPVMCSSACQGAVLDSYALGFGRGSHIAQAASKAVEAVCTKQAEEQPPCLMEALMTPTDFSTAFGVQASTALLGSIKVRSASALCSSPCTRIATGAFFSAERAVLEEMLTASLSPTLASLSGIMDMLSVAHLLRAVQARSGLSVQAQLAAWGSATATRSLPGAFTDVAPKVSFAINSYRSYIVQLERVSEALAMADTARSALLPTVCSAVGSGLCGDAAGPNTAYASVLGLITAFPTCSGSGCCAAKVVRAADAVRVSAANRLASVGSRMTPTLVAGDRIARRIIDEDFSAFEDFYEFRHILAYAASTSHVTDLGNREEGVASAVCSASSLMNCWAHSTTLRVTLQAVSSVTLMSRPSLKASLFAAVQKDIAAAVGCSEDQVHVREVMAGSARRLQGGVATSLAVEILGHAQAEVNAMTDLLQAETEAGTLELAATAAVLTADRSESTNPAWQGTPAHQGVSMSMEPPTKPSPQATPAPTSPAATPSASTAAAAPSPPSPASSSAAPAVAQPQQDAASKQVDTGLIGGISAAGLVLIGVALFVLWRRRSGHLEQERPASRDALAERQRKKRQRSPSTADAELSVADALAVSSPGASMVSMPEHTNPLFSRGHPAPRMAPVPPPPPPTDAKSSEKIPFTRIPVGAERSGAKLPVPDSKLNAPRFHQRGPVPPPPPPQA